MVNIITIIIVPTVLFAVEVCMLGPYQARGGSQLVFSDQLLVWHNAVYIKIPFAGCFSSTETEDRSFNLRKLYLHEKESD